MRRGCRSSRPEVSNSRTGASVYLILAHVGVCHAFWVLCEGVRKYCQEVWQYFRTPAMSVPVELVPEVRALIAKRSRRESVREMARGQTPLFANPK
jgi:hypothetical protein